MTITRKIEDENLVVTVLSGMVAHHELLQAIDELPQVTPNLSALYELAINAEDLQIETSSEMAEEIISKASHVFNKFKRVAISIVSPDDFTFGFARRIGTSTANEKIDISVFRTEEPARTWLAEKRFLYSAIDRSPLDVNQLKPKSSKEQK